MEVYIKQNPEEPSIKRPEYEGDAGYDLFARENPKVSGEPIGKNQTLQATYKSIDYIEYDTKLIIAPTNETSFYSMVYPRSSISKYNLSLANSVGIIDSGYRGNLLGYPQMIEQTNSNIKSDIENVFAHASAQYNPGWNEA